MKGVKKWLFLCVSMFLISGPLYAQENVPTVTLDFSEKCNNFLRHYCMSGSHEYEVNRILLDMKEKGTNITVKLIKKVAQSTPSKVYVSPSTP